MPELIADGYEINACLQECDSARMSQEVRKDIRGHSCISFVCDCRLLTENPIGPVSREGMTSGVLKQGFLWIGLCRTCHRLDGFNCFWP